MKILFRMKNNTVFNSNLSLRVDSQNKRVLPSLFPFCISVINNYNFFTISFNFIQNSSISEPKYIVHQCICIAQYVNNIHHTHMRAHQYI